jgi:protein-S-isoprenylcysteine O-methyltransferase Ste14
MLALRIRVEERYLVRELAGYAAYQRRTPWRLMPGVW